MEIDTISTLSMLIMGMDVPEMRRLLLPQDIRWLDRNLAIRNFNHPCFSAADTLIKQIIKEES